ncbi:MAG: ATP-binding cassette domain-containing protein [Clostridiaceae bacterium]|nr:ATP-binding cassette domain-containing protein [Clostridiaceae bacterium]
MLKVSNVTYSYKNDQPVLKNVSFTLRDGIAFLLGENGSGKTTLLKVITSILTSEGTLSINGIDSRSDEYKSLISYLPQEFDIYPELKIVDILRFVALLKKVDKSKVNLEVRKAAKRVNIEDILDKTFKKCSCGMKRRVGIATALIGNPQMVVMDEPTAGIDPKERIAFYKTIRECFEGKNVLISTHILDDIEILADNVVMLARGEVTYCGSYKEFRNSLNGRLFQIESKVGEPPVALSGCRVLSSEKQGTVVKYRVVGDAGIMPECAVPIDPATEDIWLYYQGGKDDVGQAG